MLAQSKDLKIAFVAVVVVAHIYPHTDPRTFHCIDYFVLGGIRACLGASSDPMFLWISSNCCPLNLLLVRSHQAEVIIVKRLIQRRNYVIRVRVEPISSDQGRRKNDASTLSATLQISHTEMPAA